MLAEDLTFSAFLQNLFSGSPP